MDTSTGDLVAIYEWVLRCKQAKNDLFRRQKQVCVCVSVYVHCHFLNERVGDCVNMCERVYVCYHMHVPVCMRECDTCIYKLSMTLCTSADVSVLLCVCVCLSVYLSMNACDIRTYRPNVMLYRSLALGLSWSSCNNSDILTWSSIWK